MHNVPLDLGSWGQSPFGWGWAKRIVQTNGGEPLLGMRSDDGALEPGFAQVVKNCRTARGWIRKIRWQAPE